LNGPGPAHAGVAGGPGGEERARLFVALDLPADAREAIEGWRSTAVRRVRGLRPVDHAALHVTLCFLGWRHSGEVGEIGAACASAVESWGPLELSLDDPLWLPDRRPRVLAVRIDDPSDRLAELQTSLSRELSGGGWYAPDPRPFVGHVTVARVPRGTRARAVKLPGPPRLRFLANQVTLYRSRLAPSGARYEPQGTVELSGRPGERAVGTRDPVSVVREFHDRQRQAYAGGDLDLLRPRLTDDVVWHVPGRSRISGEHRGVDAVLSYFDARRTMTDQTFRVTVHGMSLIDDRVVQLAGGRAVRDGRELSWETVGVFRVEDDRIAECWLVPFDLYDFDQIWR
jgi:RNA 2',3'-cyclic 3'-phosphodiesterase